MNYCSPNKQFDTNVKTCFDLSDLIVIAKAFNKWRKNICRLDTCINPKDLVKINIDLPKNELYIQLKNSLKNLCSSENCWLELDFIKSIPSNIRDLLVYFTFKPKNLSSPKIWFNTTNINEIMQQYQLLFNNTKGEKYYKFLGSQPSDITHVQRFNWQELRTRYNIISIIFNNDTHKQKGSHWNACFINNKLKSIECFDSLGKLPNKHIREFLENFKEYSFEFNHIPYQKAGTVNCGVYAVWFTLQKLKGKTFKEIQSLKLSDKFIAAFRQNNIFRPN